MPIDFIAAFLYDINIHFYRRFLMKITLVLFFRKAMAFIMSLLVSWGICSTDVPATENILRGEENTITEYSKENSDYYLSIDAANEVHEISDLLYGVFFEDINFAADGGLYAEMVINRSFEYGSLAAGDQLHGWSTVGNAENSVKINDTENALNPNNTNYLVISNTSSEKAGIANKGFLDGMAITSGVTYDFSVYAKAIDNFNGEITVRLVAGNEIAAEGSFGSLTAEWEKYELSLVSSITASTDVYLQVLTDGGEVAIDMVSLFPPTYNDHGLRYDLVEKLAELEPSFLRFPGGCIIEGYDMETAYDWKDSIGVDENGQPLEFNGKLGDVAARSYGINIWTDVAAEEDPYPCYMSYGLGFYEYFVLAEDIGAIGVPVLNCGLYCQMRGKGPLAMYTADGRYLKEFYKYIQDMLDLVEFCRGDESTVWGRVRISLGHEEPFELKYICIGNENEGEDYFERYEVFLKEFNKAKAENPELYKGIELIYSSGAAEGTTGANYFTSYENAYNYVKENGITIDEYAGATDQHYYKDPIWYLENTDYYDEDNYSRDYESMLDSPLGGGLKVFVGEYAARSNTLNAALAEAAYMTGLERNGDIVVMAAYAPLFGNLTATHWSPDLIWFNNSVSTGSINYFMQKLFSTNAGTTLLGSSLEGALVEHEKLTGMVGLGTWNTAAQFDDVKVTDNATGEVLAEDNFSILNFKWNWQEHGSEGEWKIKNGVLKQSKVYADYNELGVAAYFGDTEWSDYTYTFKATKLDGDEGFYIPFLIVDENNCFYWNIGGWGNTKSSIQRIKDGIKTGETFDTTTDFTVETGVTYEIKIVVNGTHIHGYIDGELQFDYNAESDTLAESYHVVSTDESGDIIIKLVNVTDSDRTFAIDIENAENLDSVAKVYQVAGDSLSNDNILGAEEDCIMVDFTVEGITEQFNYTVPQYSATVIRIASEK